VTDGAPDFAVWRERSADAPFTVCAFFTPDYRAKAQRLAASLDALDLPYAIFETPSVHRSISRRGVPDMRYSKPRFIAACLARVGRPVLYADCDLIFRARPAAVDRAIQEGADFAVFNWMAAPVNDAWMPVPEQPRFWRFLLTVNESSSDQLMVSGGVQFWQSTPAAHALLQDWEAALAHFTRAPDDHALDFAFNRGRACGAGLRASWLPADHMRIAFWPYVKPVIDHPWLYVPPQDGHFADIPHRFDLPRLHLEPRKPVFPRDLVLDTQQLLLLRPGPQGSLEPVWPVPCPLYLDDVGE